MALSDTKHRRKSHMEKWNRTAHQSATISYFLRSGMQLPQGNWTALLCVREVYLWSQSLVTSARNCALVSKVFLWLDKEIATHLEFSCTSIVKSLSKIAEMKTRYDACTKHVIERHVQALALLLDPSLYRNQCYEMGHDRSGPCWKHPWKCPASNISYSSIFSL